MQNNPTVNSDKKKTPAIIVDIDGTIANIDHRLHHLKSSPPDWDAFHEKICDDLPNNWCLSIMGRFEDVAIVLVTGRMECYRVATIEWLKKVGVEFDQLLMRADKDYRPDEVIKEEIYLEQINHRYEIQFVIDDRPNVVKKWRQLGLVCLQCAEEDCFNEMGSGSGPWKHVMSPDAVYMGRHSMLAAADELGFHEAGLLLVAAATVTVDGDTCNIMFPNDHIMKRAEPHELEIVKVIAHVMKSPIQTLAIQSEQRLALTSHVGGPSSVKH